MRLYDAEGGGDKPVHGAYRSGATWFICSWDLYGKYNPPHTTGLDLINA